MHLFAQGDKNAADQAAVDMMRKVLSTVQMNGIVVIGEGEKDVIAPCIHPALRPPELTRQNSVQALNFLVAVKLSEAAAGSSACVVGAMSSGRAGPVWCRGRC